MTVAIQIQACGEQLALHNHPDCSKDVLISLLVATQLCILHLQAFDNI